MIGGLGRRRVLPRLAEIERVLGDVLTQLWPDPRKLDAIDEFLAWDDFRVIDAIRDLDSDEARALRERHTIYRLAAEFNAERDLGAFTACEAALRDRFGDAVWSDSQEQMLHRMPLGGSEDAPTVRVRLMGREVDARVASDLIAKLSGKAYWRKLFVRGDRVPVDQARAICADIIATGGQPRLF